MSMDVFLKLLEDVTKLCGVFVWPLVVLYILMRFGSPIQDFLSNVAEFTFKGAGFEATATRKKAEATAALIGAVTSRPATDENSASASQEAQDAVKLVSNIVTPRVLRSAGNSRILWVDDRPANNVYERQALEALGISFMTAESTDEALEDLKRNSFDAIISDMSRPQDSRAGYTLLDALRSSGNNTPFVIYAGSCSPQTQTIAKQKGALGCTNSPNDLFQMVLSALHKDNAIWK